MHIFSANFDYVSSEVIGQSYEGRDLRLLKICTDGCNDAKPAMYIDGGDDEKLIPLEWLAQSNEFVLQADYFFKTDIYTIFLKKIGIHAREWIAPAVVTYLINELTANRDPANDDLVNSLDW